MKEAYRYSFTARVPLQEAIESLYLGVFAAEGVHGRAQVRLDAGYAFDEKARTLVVDADAPVGHAAPLLEPMQAAIAGLKAFRDAGLPAYLERSGRGHGWHIWCFFNEPVPAAKARALGHLLAPKEALLAAGGFADASVGRGIEV